MSGLEEFQERFQKSQSTISCTTDKTLQQRVEHNTEVLKWVIEVILCGKQWLPLRGHRENINNSSHNSGNFLAILKLLTSFFLLLLTSVVEVESHHVEQLPLCIRFVDDKKNTREEFLEFGK